MLARHPLGLRYRGRQVRFGCSGAPRVRVVVPGGRLSVASRGDGYKPPPRDATPRSVLRIVSRARPLLSKAGRYVAETQIAVNRKIRYVMTIQIVARTERNGTRHNRLSH